MYTDDPSLPLRHRKSIAIDPETSYNDPTTSQDHWGGLGDRGGTRGGLRPDLKKNVFLFKSLSWNPSVANQLGVPTHNVMMAISNTYELQV